MNATLGRVAAHLIAAVAFAATAAHAQEPAAPPPAPAAAPKPAILITNARVFDGKSTALTGPMSVLVEGNKISKIAASIPAPTGATIIDAGGRTLSPGFIDAHAHVTLQLPPNKAGRVDQWYYALAAAQAAKIYLSRGFTTVRDAAGNPFSVKMAIDEGMIVGPRIYPSGPLISQTSGHADHRSPNEPSALLGGDRDLSQKYGLSLVVDGVPQVLEAVRQQLFRGASQIKIAVSGGTGSESDPLDVVEFTPDEVRAAVQAAASWHTYVMAHAYAPEAIRMAVENGVKTIEHGNLIDEPTLQLMKDKGVWLSAQISTYTVIPPGYTEDQAKKHRQAYAGIDNMFKTAKKIGFDKIGFGTDIISNLDFLKRASEEFVLRTKWFTPAEILKQATYNNGQIVALSGPRNPYPGKLGVIEEGALADLLLINGDPLADISILAKPEQNLSLIMKDGVIYKNTIDGRAVVAGL